MVIAAIALLLDEEEQKVNKKIIIDGSVWFRPWTNRRKEEGMLSHIVSRIKTGRYTGFFYFLFMHFCRPSTKLGNLGKSRKNSENVFPTVLLWL